MRPRMEDSELGINCQMSEWSVYTGDYEEDELMTTFPLLQSLKQSSHLCLLSD
jgi:hypothetical protein